MPTDAEARVPVLKAEALATEQRCLIETFSMLPSDSLPSLCVRRRRGLKEKDAGAPVSVRFAGSATPPTALASARMLLAIAGAVIA